MSLLSSKKGVKNMKKLRSFKLHYFADKVNIILYTFFLFCCFSGWFMPLFFVCAPVAFLRILWNNKNKIYCHEGGSKTP